MVLSSKKIKKYDKSDMFSLLVNFSEQCYKGYNIIPPEIDKKFNKIVFSGMGGSGISGDVLKVLIEEKSKIPLFVIKDYNLPDFIDSDTLFIAESFSGNTEETISTLNIAKNRNCKIVCLSSNGKLENLSKEENLPFIKIPSFNIPPRTAFGYLFFSVYRLFVELGLLPKLYQDFFEKIEKWCKKFSLLDETNETIKFSLKIYKKILLIYSENRLYPCILRWKTQIAENSKSFSFINLLPEMNHNEIMSFYFPEFFLKRVIVLFTISGLENERIKKRIEITSNIICKKVKEVIKLECEGATLLEKMLYLIIFGDWVSFYLAILNRVDPTEIPEINLLKKELEK